MANPGKFLIKHFKGKEIEIWTSNEGEVVKYNDTDNFSWTVLKGKLLDYDEESGVLILETPTKSKFFLNEWVINLAWEPGVDIREFTKNTTHALKPRNRDIM